MDRYKALVVAENDRGGDAGIADADGAAYAMALLGLPLIAYSYDWVSSVWAYLGLAIAGPALGGIGMGMGAIACLQLILIHGLSQSRIGVRLAHLIPLLLMGLGIGLFQPSWVGSAFGIFLCVSFLVSDRNSFVNRRLELERLGTWSVLDQRTVSLPVAQLDPWVRTQLEQALASRAQLQGTLVDTLDDAGIDLPFYGIWTLRLLKCWTERYRYQRSLDEAMMRRKVLHRQPEQSSKQCSQQ